MWLRECNPVVTVRDNWVSMHFGNHHAGIREIHSLSGGGHQHLCLRDVPVRGTRGSTWVGCGSAATG